MTQCCFMNKNNLSINIQPYVIQIFIGLNKYGNELDTLIAMLEFVEVHCNNDTI